MADLETRLLPGEEVLFKARISWMAFIIAIGLLVGLMVTGQMTGLMTTKLILTNKRLMGKVGLFWRRNISVVHADIEVVRVKFGLLGKIFDYGTIMILTKKGEKIAFKGISEPLYIKMQIEEAVEISVLGHTLEQYTSHKF